MAPLTLRNFGGTHQLVFATEKDLQELDTLDPARWAATSAPLRDLHCDPGLLAFVDAKGNGRIRVEDLLAARDWAFARLRGRKRIEEQSDELLLDDLDASTPEGQKLRHAAEHVARELKLADPSRLKLADVRAFRAGYAQTLANGDGVVPPTRLPEPEVAEFAREVMSVVGGAPDASGEAGVGEAQLQRFIEGGKAFLEWRARPERAPDIVPLGAETEPALAAVRALDAKIEEYFLVCDLLRQEQQAASALKPTDEEWKSLRARGAPGIESYLAAAPLAQPSAAGELAMAAPVNPAFEGAWAALNEKVLSRLAPGKGTIDRVAWRKLKATFDPYLAWQKEKPAEPFETVKLEHLDGHLIQPLQQKLHQYIDVDKAAAPELAQVIELEKLILYQRGLLELANNLASFSALYDPSKTALIEMGTLVLDGRRLEFCARVEGRAAHRPVAAESLIFLVYAQVLEKDGAAPAFEVVAPVTSGERGRLRAGKRGIFVDTAGKEWDAVITEVVENPISIKEAMLAPFRRLQKSIAQRIESMLAKQQASREAAMGAQAGGAVDKGAEVAAKAADVPPAPAPAPAAPEKKDSSAMQNLLIGGSIAFAAIGSALAYVISAVTSISPIKLLGGIAGLIAAVAGVSALLGWLKLRRRDMGMLFEAGGWAINPRMKITRRLGIIFTWTPEFPAGTFVDRRDALAGLAEIKAQDKRRAQVKRRIWGVAALVAIGAAGWVWYRYFRR